MKEWKLIIRKNNKKIYGMGFDTVRPIIFKLIEFSEINNIPDFLNSGKLVSHIFMGKKYTKSYEFRNEIPNLVFTIKKMSIGDIDETTISNAIDICFKALNGVKDVRNR